VGLGRGKRGRKIALDTKKNGGSPRQSCDQLHRREQSFDRSPGGKEGGRAPTEEKKKGNTSHQFVYHDAKKVERFINAQGRRSVPAMNSGVSGRE